MGSGEFALLASLRPYLDGDADDVPLGVDDDAAVVEVAGAPVALAVDTLIEGVHVDLQVSSLGDVGWKAVAVNVSDLAATGATPRAALISLQRRPDLEDDQVRALYAGMREAADRWGVRLVGGDTVTSPTFAVSLTVVGALLGDGPLRRDGAVPGDLVVVVGPLGLAAAGLALHRAGAQDLLAEHPELLAAHRRPDALPAVGGALVACGASAAIDVSDGLGRDLGHVASRSGVRVQLEEARLPRAPGVVAAAARLGVDPVELVVGGGDDYALAACVAPEAHDRLQAALRATGQTAVTVGQVTTGSGVHLVAAGGRSRPVDTLGWEHT